MDLQALLKKTESRSSKIKATRSSPDIATEDRPYSNDLPTEQQVEPKLGQTEAKVETEPKPKLGQTEAKLRPSDLTELKQTIETEAKVRPELRPHHEPKLGQTEAKVRPNSSITELVGLQRNLLFSVYDSCRFAGSKISASLSVQFLVNASNSTSHAVRKAIQRLEEKGFIQRANYKDGRGGWTQYRLPDEIYSALLHDETEAKVRPKLSQTEAKLRPQLRPQLRPSFSSSSSLIDLENLKTTTREPEPFDQEAVRLTPEWERIDPSPLESIGFTLAHLIQIARQGKISPQETHDSIQFFAFDLRRNGKAQSLNGSPLNFFMGILRKGIPYAPPENYVSSEDEARREYRERMRRLEETRVSEAQEIWDLHFREWEASLTAEECSQILPEYARKIGPVRESCLRNHFNEKVWPDLRLTVPGLSSVFDPPLPVTGLAGLTSL